ncbi:WD repeat-containing protein 54 isoform X3 [Myotis yumanensis]|uniref:WD repeat-containing protein 54 isoform X3 n=1 Tax=Myotis yumanensis TaxID=159337 RepID=UPI0038D410DA
MVAADSEGPSDPGVRMFRRQRSIPLRGSAAALCNNLSVLHLPVCNLTHFGVVHGPSAQLLSVAPEGVPLAQRQLHAKEGAGVSSPLITQMYESYGSVMVYWHALDSRDASPVQAMFARGIASCGHFICVGMWSGRVLVFDIPAKGPNIVLSEELAGHPTSVTDIASEPAQEHDCMADVVTADDSGLLCVWRSGPEFKLLTRIPGFGVPCTSVQLWKGIAAAGYGNGQVRLYETSTGALHVQINAHARAICALDLAPEVGKLLSAAEDTFVHIWKLSKRTESGCTEVEHCHGECVPDTQVCGARFCDPSGSSFAVTGYDLAEILRFSSE